MKTIFRDILNLIYPPCCHICETKLGPHEKYLCLRCLTELPRTGYHRMPDNPMEQRFAGRFPFERATGLFFYSKGSGLSQLIQDMKYRSFPGIGRTLGKLAAQELYTTGFLSDSDVVAAVPMHWFKKAVRGYNQAEEIARGLSEELGIPLVNPLSMTRLRKTQTRLGMAGRLRNADSLFKANKNVSLDGKGVVLIDDICTTGTTLGSAASTLMKSWPEARLTLLTIGVTF